MAGDEDDLILQFMVSVTGWWGSIEPYHTDDNLHKSAQEDQEELKVEAPPLSVETCRDLCLEDKKDTVGFHEDAGDAEDKADAKSWLSQTASPILRLTNEEQ